MRKLLIVVPLLLSVSLFGQLRVSADVGGTFKIEQSGDGGESDAKMGITLGYDYGIGSSGAIDYGAGGEYQLNRGLDEEGSELEFGFTSVYGFGKYNISPAMYAVSRVGYAAMYNVSGVEGDIDTSGGVMWSIGFGYPFNEQMSFEGGYASNAGTMDSGGGTWDATYARGYFTFNYSF
ncbi:MAG: hypothetical protein CMG69_00685 [Candidatus Marinimicrobia bacterium]|nr:hypothetical protein [Candidatus Neomarinimicrobiota bacterium]|tara:strand:- start:72 stop:605 length:534 start_codon:yes stop_codon:yes gene_type:complete